MSFANARIITVDEARTLVTPVLASFMAKADLEIALDHELMFADDYESSGILALPDGAVVEGDLVLDPDEAVAGGTSYRGIIALGALTVTGDIVNACCDGGPFLVTLGPLHVRHILKGGATMIAVGPVTALGTIYCSFNHGGFRAWGGVTAQAIFIDDQLYEIAGHVEAVKLVLGEDDPAGYLVPELLWEEDDGSLIPMDDFGEEVTARIKAGEPVFQAEAPRHRRG